MKTSKRDFPPNNWPYFQAVVTLIFEDIAQFASENSLNKGICYF